MSEQYPNPVKIRPHHVDPLYRVYEDSGYAEKLRKGNDTWFIGRQALNHMVDYLLRLKNEFPRDTQVVIVPGLDDVCERCTNSQEPKCSEEDTIGKNYNTEVAKRIGLGLGQNLTLGELFARFNLYRRNPRIQL